MKIKFVLVIWLVVVSISCDSRLKENLNGLWVLEEIYVEDQDFQDSIHWPLVSFDQDFMSIPSLNSSTSTMDVEWDIAQYKGVDTLIIKSSDKVFKGKYKMSFAQDQEDASVYCKLVSIKTTIVLHKVNLNIPEF